ncbi:hypothetical protein [Bacteroides helcogenes]|uniref:Outer membrane protein beta-barrel domain-containing protein n=1 Tax=Bacteroides helcogenes (strain ATCC 35417 / DSM 20613 / JCM 6297 / CCUG 15421 / P 36-108) TaxID=693979 RepID=E6SSZ0_BACT6|nr:hypothetical protein [Bacteroides helcogenes]ADV44221.1 hypothetical protein Bache_2252 [Bacteroides helcogenes P 36-108]MDY5238365.1 hypothetical protein [Bacteroides helcogenes]
MKISVKHCFLLFGLLMQGVPFSAQNTFGGNSKLSVYAGTSRYMGKFVGITNNSSSYRNGLRNGTVWSADYYYTGIGTSSCRFASGFMYQGSRYNNYYEEGTDKIQMHYIAPQAAFYYVKPQYSFSAGVGVGYQLYKDKSTVFDKPRDVSMNKLAFNISAGGEYLFTSHVGIAVKLNWITSGSDTYSVKYHGREWQVETPQLSDGGGAFSQLSFLIGLNFHF